ncbi:hypothetical protein L873DRAFT_1841265 [Choiromyces venosus 120613-1]|uniref:Uncharacterized protein n=1 Tax=Choiromyces venosus 120613-1 TaxID=1336337 RepID=A0A3N4K1M6_9PEZI|nr:hypothetical protein L873DRAFT_1841265 [Choiromyces venosus 120613-1]
MDKVTLQAKKPQTSKQLKPPKTNEIHYKVNPRTAIIQVKRLLNPRTVSEYSTIPPSRYYDTVLTRITDEAQLKLSGEERETPGGRNPKRTGLTPAPTPSTFRKLT